ncbi:MAG: hypothetical protein R3344_05190, partial [Acidobacteriota bacterium]|nr:hypothetical protein [Acidobacteriota bacterium]
GGGGPSAAGDATWIHTFWDTSFWAAAGGDFVAGASASTTVDQNGPYTWGSTAGMVADVQSWLDNPGNNFGWIVLGDESTAPLPSAKRFDSRENAATAPVLTVNFTEDGPPPEGVPTVSEWGLILMLLLLATAGTILFGQRRAVLAGAGEGFLSQGTVRPPLLAGLFLKTFAAVAGAAMLAFATAFILFGEITSVDLTGAVLCIPVLAYLIHLWLLPRKE